MKKAASKLAEIIGKSAAVEQSIEWLVGIIAIVVLVGILLFDFFGKLYLR